MPPRLVIDVTQMCATLSQRGCSGQSAKVLAAFADRLLFPTIAGIVFLHREQQVETMRSSLHVTFVSQQMSQWN